MPELTLYRLHPVRNPTPMICMYCGADASHKRQWLAENLREERGRGGGASLTPVPTGDDPVSGIIAVLLFPILLWEAIKATVGAVGAVRTARRAGREAKRLPPLDPPTTLVTVTTCPRHRWFALRFVWAGLLTAAGLAVLWYFAVRAVRAEGTEETVHGTILLTAAVVGTVAVPLGLSFWYVLAGPVIVDRVGQDMVVLDRVRTAYFERAGIPLPGDLNA
jgi:hypothetical protein